jgi:ATP-dependent DNA helicase DinG
MSRKNVMNEALLDIIKLLKYSENMNMKNIESFMNEEMKNRYIKSNVVYLENEVLKVKYFNQSYLIPKERLRY